MNGTFYMFNAIHDANHVQDGANPTQTLGDIPRQNPLPEPDRLVQCK
jgi:hypothetical protein